MVMALGLCAKQPLPYNKPYRGGMLTSSGSLYKFDVYSPDSSKTMGISSKVFNLNQLFLKPQPVHLQLH